MEPAVEARDRYAAPARILHWLVAAALPVQLALAWAAENTDDRAAGFRLIRTHYQLGIVIAALMLLRLSWRMARGAPSPLRGEPRYVAVWRA